MTGDQRTGNRILGILRSADGKGIVRVEDRFDTDIDDLWSAVTDPRRLARWMCEVEGDLRLGGEFHARFFASGWEGTGRVEVCEPPDGCGFRPSNPTSQTSRPSRSRCPSTATRPSSSGRNGACPQTSSPPMEPASRFMSKISPPTSPGVSAATLAPDGTSSSRPIRVSPPAAANHTAPPCFRRYRMSICGRDPLRRAR